MLHVLNLNCYLIFLYEKLELLNSLQSHLSDLVPNDALDSRRQTRTVKQIHGFPCERCHLDVTIYFSNCIISLCISRTFICLYTYSMHRSQMTWLVFYSPIPAPTGGISNISCRHLHTYVKLLFTA